MKKYHYHQWTLKDVERHFKVSNKEGLNQKEAKSRLMSEGPNSLVGIKKVNSFDILGRQLTNFFTILLVVAAAISLFSEGLAQTIVLVLIIVFNVAVGFFQERKAEISLQALKRSMSHVAKVLREGTIVEIDSEKVVSGDIIILSEGDRVPADMRLIEEEGLRVNEAALTGESSPISKKITVLKKDTPLAERVNMAYVGTSIYAGKGRGVVIATGSRTKFGEIAKMVTKKEEKTPLEKRILRVGKYLAYIAMAITLMVFVLGIYRGWEMLELLTFVIAVLIASVPESLPTIITLALAVGVIGMVKKKAVVRRLSVIEALGSVDIIATDKTGTLTCNKLEVSRLGYFSSGQMIVSSGKPLVSKKEKELLFYGALASDASGERPGSFVGDPLEVAILERLVEVSGDKFGQLKKFETMSQVPFSSDNQYMMINGKLGSEKLMVAKGALSQIIKFCQLSSIKKKKIISEYNKLSRQGLKVIAVCKKKLGRSAGDLKHMKFIGIIGFSDEPAEGVAEAIRDTIKAGIRPIMITGDHPETALYIAQKIGLEVEKNQIVTGEELKTFSTEELKRKVDKVKIFARVSPKDKIDIVNALEERGYSVAVTGDGVNDAPALKAATVGIAMGIRGSDVSKEAADIVLTDDNYSTIVSAIAWGRKIYDNIRNALIFLLAGNFDEILLIALAFILNLPAPFTAVQILWVNLITDSLPAIALAFEKPNEKVLEEKPRSSQESSVISAVWYAIILGTFSLLISVILYIWGLHHSVDKARTLVFLMAILSEMVYILSIRSPKRIWQDVRGFFGNNYLNGAIVISIGLGLVTLVPAVQPFFNTTSLTGFESVVLIVSILVAFGLAETFRIFYDKYYYKRNR